MSSRSEWDDTYRKLSSEEVLWSRAPELDDFLPIARKEGVRRILDAGCGDGKNVLGLLRESGLECVGVDSSTRAIEICKREVANAASGPRDHLPLAVSRLEDLPFAADTFDAAICIDVINHCRLPYPVFAELSRVVKDAGLLYMSLFNVEDEILSGKRAVASMRPLPGGIVGREFLYHFQDGPSDSKEYYFRFLAIDEVEGFLRPTNLELIDKRVRFWKNPPHPHFRPYEHTHCNIMVTARNHRRK